MYSERMQLGSHREGPFVVMRRDDPSFSPVFPRVVSHDVVSHDEFRRRMEPGWNNARRAAANEERQRAARNNQASGSQGRRRPTSQETLQERFRTAQIDHERAAREEQEEAE